MNGIKGIPGWEGVFSVGEDGTVYRHISGVLKPLQGTKTYHGYRKVHLKCGTRGEVKMVHRLIAEAFIDNYSADDFVTHINGNKQDNRIENLVCLSPVESRKRFPRSGENNYFAKLTDKTVRAIKRQIRDSKQSNEQIAADYSVSERTIRNIASGKTWKHLA